MPRTTDSSPFKLSLQLADFTKSDLFEPSSSTHQRQLVSWLSKPPRGANAAAQIPVAAIYHAIADAAAAGTLPSQQQASQLHKIGTALASAAHSAASVLAASTGAAALSPDDEAVAVSNLRMSFFFLAHLLKITGTWKDTRGAAFKPSTIAWQLRSTAFSALNATQAACTEPRIAALLVLHAALDIVAHPLPAHDADAKSAAEICRRSMCDHLAGLMSPRDGQSESVAAAAADALLALLEQPKQTEGVVKEVHRIICAVMARSALAGCSLVGLAVRRAGAEGSSADALAALLASLAATSSAEGPSLRAALVSYASEVVALLAHTRPAVRKAALDLVGSLGAQQDGIGSSWFCLYFATAVRGLSDEDATLRAKALGALEATAAAAAEATVWTRSPDEHTPNGLGITPDFFASSLAARLIDRSVTVRKKAVATVAALAAADPSPAPCVSHALQRHVVPVIAKLLQQPHDSKLYPGEAGAALLSTALTSLASAASQDAYGVLQLLQLWRNSQDESSRSNFGAAIARACLAPPTASQPSLLLDEVVQQCSMHVIYDLREIVHQEPRFAALVQAAMERTAQRAADIDAEDLLSLCRAIYVLVDSNPGEESAEQLQWLLGVARSIVGIGAVAGADGAEALHWCLEAAELCHFTPDQASSIAALVRDLSVSHGVAPEEVLSAVALLQQLPSPKDAMCALLRDIAQVAGLSSSGDLLGAAPAAVEDSVCSTATTSFLTVLSALSASCVEEKTRFLDNLRAESVAVGAEEGEGGYLAEESDAKAQEAAAQKFLDELLAAEDSLPSIFIPKVLEIAASPLAGPLDRAEALRVLGSLAQLSQPLAERCAPIVGPLLDVSTHGSPLVCLAAIHFSRAVVTSFPAVCSHLLSRFSLLLNSSDISAGQLCMPCFVAQTASEVVAALLTSGRLRVHDWMSLVALGLVHTNKIVALMLRNALINLLDAAGSAAERAALVLAVAHQAHEGAREAAATAAVGLLKASDCSSDALVSPCLSAALAAAAAGRSDTEQAHVAAALLRPLKPSLKTLRLLVTGLETTATGPLPPVLCQALHAFVHRAVVAAPAAAEEEQAPRKRGREGKASAAALQAQLLETLAARAAPRPRRHQR